MRIGRGRLIYAARIRYPKGKNVMKKLTAILLAMIIFLIPTLTSCGEVEERPYVVLSKANVVLSVGDEYTLGAKVYPENKSDLPVEWTTSNSDVVTCEGGKLKAHSTGSAVVMASVGGGNAFSVTVNVGSDVRKHVNMIVGETVTVAKNDYNTVFSGEFDWISTNSAVATCEGGVISAAAVGDTVIRISQGTDVVSMYSVSVFENVEAMVEFSAPELPVSLSYMSGKSTLEVQEFTYTVTEEEDLPADRLMVTFTVTYTKTADISGSQSKNKTGFYIELYSDEVGYCTTYKVESDLLFVNQSATFSTNFIADVANGMRHFNIKLVPIEK